MIVTCEQCTTQFHLDDAKVPEEGIRVRCSRCKHAFLIESPNRSDADQAVELARSALDAAPQDDVEADWQFNEEVQPKSGGPAGLDGRGAAEAAVDDLLGASFGNSLDAPSDGNESLGDSPTSPGELDAGSGDPGASVGELEVGSGDPGAFVGDFEAGSGDPGASVDDLEAGPGDSGASVSDLDASFGDPGTSVSDLDASFGDPGASVSDLDASFGDPGASVSDLDASFGDPGASAGDLEADFGSAGDFEADIGDPGTATDEGETSFGDSLDDLDVDFGLDESAAEEELGLAGSEPDPDADIFADPAGPEETGGEASPAETAATDAPPTAAAPGPAAVDDALDLASDVEAAADPADLLNLGDPEEWEDEAAAESAGSAQSADVAVEHVAARAEPDAAHASLTFAPVPQGIDASALEADLENAPGNVWIARGRDALGWSVVCALCVYAGFLGLVATGPAPSVGDVHWSIAGLDGHEIEGRWIENAVAGPIYVVSGDLRVDASGSSESGALLRVRLVDAAGRPVAAESAAVGAPIPSERLREWNLRDLRGEQERSARRLARSPLRPGERRPFAAVLGGVPPTAKGFEITRSE